MTNGDLSLGWVRQARAIFEEAKRHQGNSLWHLAVRRCQEAVELALKGLMGFSGIEVPHVHDVGHFLIQHKDKLPKELAAHLEAIQSISRRLREERETSFYGDEELMLPPDQLYNAQDARQAVEDAEFVISLVEGLIRSRQ